MNHPAHYGFDKIGVTSEQADELVARMSEPHRVYHTIPHVEYILEQTSDPLLIAAAWFHDAVYDPTRTDNEARSSYLATIFYFFNPPSFDVLLLGQIIMDTAKHEATHPLSQKFSDLDMSILGSNSDRYDEYYKAIRQEFAFVPWATYCSKRSEILQAFNKKKIFYTAEFDHLEPVTHDNLTREINQLQTLDESSFLANW